MRRDERLRCGSPRRSGFASTEPSARHLHVAEARQRADPLLQVGGVLRLAPDPRRVAAVILRDDRCQLAHTRGHRAREAVDRRLLLERRLEVDRGELRRVERSEALLQHERSRERFLHGHLLVDREADEQRERVACEQLTRRLVGCEVERGGPRIPGS